MLTIKTMKDICRIRDQGLLPEVLMFELEEYFKDLTRSLTGEEDAWKNYNIGKDGPILVMQPGMDDPNDLKEFGITREYGGIFGATPEFCSIVELDGELKYIRTVIVLDNSFAIAVYSPMGQFEGLDDYLLEYLVE